MKIYKQISGVTIDISTDGLDERAKKAHAALNMQVMADCNPLVPFGEQGALRGNVMLPQGIYGNEIEWNTPYAHYQYVGDLYLTQDGRSFAQKYEKKYPTGVPLKHRIGTSGWFEEAKEKHLDEWVSLVGKEIEE